MSLTQQLEELKTSILTQIPKDTQKVMLANFDDLTNSGIANQAPATGDKIKPFALQNQNGESRTLEDILKQGPAIITFYRGGWCPYCNLELRAYQQALMEIKAAGASLVAITPELPDASLSTIEKEALEFEILSDVNSDYGRELGIVFTLAEELRPIYKSFGIEVEKHNGEGQFDLPLAATFVVDTDGAIVFSFVDVNYMHRADPADVIEAVQSLRK